MRAERGNPYSLFVLHPAMSQLVDNDGRHFTFTPVQLVTRPDGLVVPANSAVDEPDRGNPESWGFCVGDGGTANPHFQRWAKPDTAAGFVPNIRSLHSAIEHTKHALDMCFACWFDGPVLSAVEETRGAILGNGLVRTSALTLTGADVSTPEAVGFLQDFGVGLDVGDQFGRVLTLVVNLGHATPHDIAGAMADVGYSAAFRQLPRALLFALSLAIHDPAPVEPGMPFLDKWRCACMVFGTLGSEVTYMPAYLNNMLAYNRTHPLIPAGVVAPRFYIHCRQWMVGLGEYVDEMVAVDGDHGAGIHRNYTLPAQIRERSDEMRAQLMGTTYAFETGIEPARAEVATNLAAEFATMTQIERAHASARRRQSRARAGQETEEQRQQRVEANRRMMAERLGATSGSQSDSPGRSPERDAAHPTGAQRIDGEARLRSLAARYAHFSRENNRATAWNTLQSELHHAMREQCRIDAAERQRRAHAAINARRPGASGPSRPLVQHAEEDPGLSAASKRKGKKAISRQQGEELARANAEREALRVRQREEQREARRLARQIGGN